MKYVKNKRILFFLLLLAFSECFAQKRVKRQRQANTAAPLTELVYDNFNYLPEVKSVELFNSADDQSFPLWRLGSSEHLILKFDDLRPGNHSLYYSLEHCTSDWKPSALSPIDYLESFSEDRINNYKNAFNTYKAYTHYELQLPNLTVIPKLSGNYLLKVYEDGDLRRLLLTRRLYVLAQKVQIGAQIIQSGKIAERNKRQKLNFSVFHPALAIQNPYQEIKVLVMQNARSDQSVWNSRPLFIRSNELVYSDISTNDFFGGNEFRTLDTRSLRFKSQYTASITLDSIYRIQLFPDADWNNASYTSLFDENGKFFILNQDGSDADYDADYAEINFTLDALQPDPDHYTYIVGNFNAWQRQPENRMVYDPARQLFHLNLLLKQGVYNYHYIWADESGKIVDDHIFDGSFFQTENNYQILVYYQRPGARYEELIGFSQINSLSGTTKN